MMSGICCFRPYFVVTIAFCICFSVSLSIQDLPESGHNVFHGIIKEDAEEGDEVELDSSLSSQYAVNAKSKICGYTIYKAEPGLPFKIILLDKNSGDAKIVLGSGFQLDHEAKHRYSFEIAAHDCASGRHMERSWVHIEVEDVNEYAPVWQQQTYYVEAVEGRFYDPLVHMLATDGDGTDTSSKICHYHILTSDVPFEVDSNGFLRNTEPLDFGVKQNYVIEVTAEDCSHRTSEKAIVNIDVKAVCQPGWIGFPDRVEFTPRDGRKLIAPNAELELCDGICNLTQITVAVKLATAHIGKGCDRDTYSLHSQRKLCGASDDTIDLLPSPSFGSWTKDLPTDDGRESDEIFAFDGRSVAIEIPSDKMDPRLGSHFTISTWMKHDDPESESNKSNVKEHILCHSDGEDMNRHHYALFIRHCRLVLLLRQEADSGVDANTFKPAEWRWTTPEVCDGKWHHYAVSIDLLQARLYIDGKQFAESKHNPEIVDDFPLHQSKHVHFTKLVVGACWLGGKHHMGQYFHGYLAGLSILKNQTESDRVIQCLNNCQEKLDFTAIDEMETGMTVSMNNEMTSVSISGINLESVENLLHKVGYINTRTFPTPGHRPVTLETHAMCAGEKPLPIDVVKALIMVLEAEKPVIVLGATTSFQQDGHNLIRGEKIFHNLEITAHTKSEEDEIKNGDSKKSEYSDKYQLDSCLIHIEPQLNLDVEHLRYPENLVKQLGLQVDVSEDGLVVAGADKLRNYEEVLSGIHYVNKRPEDLNRRTFLLTCTELNGRFVSNQLEVTLEVVHVHPEQTAAPHAANIHRMVQPQANILHSDKSMKHDQRNSDGPQTVTGIVVICIVCIGFILLLVVLGVMRIRNAQRHSRDVNVDEKQEMEWDNSALTITVNPMDQEAMFDEDVHTGGLQRDESDSEGEGSFHDNDAESSEEEPEKVKKGDLEWDDSTLSF